MRDHRGPGRACDAHIQLCHKQQIQPHIQQRRYCQEYQRSDRIAERAQQARQIIVQRRGDQSGEYDQQIAAHAADHLVRHAQKRQYWLQKGVYCGVERQRDQHDEHECVGDAPAQHGRIAAPAIDGKQRAGAHGQPQKDGCEEGHQRIGRAHGGQRVRAQHAPYDQRIGDIVELLEQISRHHRQCKQDQRARDRPARQVSIHGSISFRHISRLIIALHIAKRKL